MYLQSIFLAEPEYFAEWIFTILDFEMSLDMFLDLSYFEPQRSYMRVFVNKIEVSRNNVNKTNHSKYTHRVAMCRSQIWTRTYIVLIFSRILLLGNYLNYPQWGTTD